MFQLRSAIRSAHLKFKLKQAEEAMGLRLVVI
jgi:hypothetical protein